MKPSSAPARFLAAAILTEVESAGAPGALSFELPEIGIICGIGHCFTF
jgi:hypothetical protein